MSVEEEITQVNFASGQPPENLLPFKLVSDATSKLLIEYVAHGNCTGTVSPLSYGDNFSFFSQRLAKFLETECGREYVDPDLLVPTAGVSNALDLISTMLCKNLPRSKVVVVFVEDATYYLSMGIFEDHDLHIHAVPMDEYGIVIHEFRQLLQDMSREDSPYLPLFLYTIPTFHNPTGRTMPVQRRLELLHLTREYNVTVVADEVYQMLGFTDILRGEPPQAHNYARDCYPSLVSLACPADDDNVTTAASVGGGGSCSFDHVISVSSFSKLLAPGLRVGWAEFSSPTLAQRFRSLGVLRSGSSICHFASCVAVSCMLLRGDGEQRAAEDTLTDTERRGYGHEASGSPAEEHYLPCPLRTHIRHVRGTLADKYGALTSALMRYSNEYLRSADGRSDHEVGLDLWCTKQPAVTFVMQPIHHYR